MKGRPDPRDYTSVAIGLLSRRAAREGVALSASARLHVSTEAVRAELPRNEGLRRLIGIESEAGVAKLDLSA
jgi:hypothetical protein